jgi:hypothetical protein
MKKILLLLVVIAGICYYYNPPFESHRKALVSEAPQDLVSSGKIDEKIDEKIKDNLDFINLYVASATKDKQRLSIVTFGVFEKVMIIDNQWLPWVLKGRP